MARRFIAFSLVGGVAAMLNVAVGQLFALFMDLELAIVLAFPIALTFAYSMNSWLVFRTEAAPSLAEYGRFALVNLLSLGVVWIVTVMLARIVFPATGFTWRAEAVAHLFGVLSPVAVSFWGHKVFTFRRRTVG